MELNKLFPAILIVFLIGVLVVISIVIFVTIGGIQSTITNSTSENVLADNGTATALAFNIQSVSSAVAHNNSWLEFDGVNDEIVISSLNGSTFNYTEHDNFSISIWVEMYNCADVSTNSQFIGVAQYLIIDWTQACEVRFGVRNFTNSANSAGGVSLNNHTLYHLVGTYNSSDTNLTLYINGIKNDTANNTISNLYNSKTGNSQYLSMGGARALSGDGSYLDGRLDEARVYNRTLGDSEVLEIYNSGRIPNSSLTSDGLVGWWSFEAGTGTTLYDKSGNNHNGI